MVQIEKLGDKSEKDKHTIDMNDQDKTSVHNIQSSNSYSFLSRRNIEKVKYYESGFGNADTVIKQGLKCYVSYDLNNLVIGGLNLGTERFNLPFDYFKRATLIMDKN